ncbi:MAG: hypothetical protein QOK37_4393 [Thermoanaerobaculia bacterium]|jgi:pimeloyl-ACP methyl ester carboxylesterase|nr:hypothetical protein [Thermoanaerobaculia bacterium]
MNVPRFLRLALLIALALPLTAQKSVFVTMPCPPDLKAPSVRCGTIAVPEDAKLEGGRTVDLNVVVIGATHPTANAVPLFHLDGGPGIAATNAAGFYAGPGGMYKETRDIVVFDQRGTGGSNALHCPAIEHRHPLDDMYTTADVIACRDALRSRADLSRYSTEVAASDIDRVRSALGYAQVDLWAISYGTRLAQAYMKQFTTRVHRAVLTGFTPLDYRAPLYHAVNAQRVIDLILYECQRDRTCSARYPNLRHEWQSLLHALDETPVKIETASGTKVLRRGPFAEALRSFLYTAAAQRQLPFLIHAAASGDFAPFLAILPKGASPFADGLYLSIACSEGAARIKGGEVAPVTNGTALGDYRLRQELDACAEWPKYAVPEDFYTPQKASPPVLVIAGSMDPVGAPEWSDAYCTALPNCRLVTIPNLGHGPFDLDVWTAGGCFDELSTAFYKDPASLDPSCVKRMQPPAFK